jgi:hypothetical protein
MGFGLALIGRFKLWIYAAGAALVAIGAAYLRGRSDEAGAEHERELNEYVETRKRMDDADPSDGVEFLLERKSKRNL